MVTFLLSLPNLSRLKHLNLLGNYFTGTIPHQLGNLSHMQYLSVSYWDYESSLTSDPKWLSSLSSSLTTLTLQGVDLTSADNWSQLVSKLHHLRELDLSYSNLPDIAPLSICNMNVSTSLTHIDLSFNDNLTSMVVELPKQPSSPENSIHPYTR